jgi:hypothetical protein
LLDRLLGHTPLATALNAALDEAWRRGDRRLGTEHLLLGLLHDPATAETLGVGLGQARAALDTLDRAALASVGIHIDPVLPAATDPAPKRPPLSVGSLTSNARAILRPDAGKRPQSFDALLAELLRCTPPDPAAELLAALGVDIKPPPPGPA